MNAGEFRFLSVEDVLELHEMQLESYGGATGIRASDLLESGDDATSFIWRSVCPR